MNRTPLRRVADYAVLSVLAFLFVLPVLYLILGSFKPSDQVLNGLTGFCPPTCPSTTTPPSWTASTPTPPATSGASWVSRCSCPPSWCSAD